jgi:hypothetical protein
MATLTAAEIAALYDRLMASTRRADLLAVFGKTGWTRGVAT